MASPIANLFVRLGADTKQFHNGMRRARQDLNKTDAATAKFSAGMASHLKLGLAAAAVALGLAIRGVINEANEFNAELANVATLIPGDIVQIHKFRGEIQALSVDLGKSVKDLTGGLYESISAFGEQADTMEIVTIAAKSARAGISDTNSSLKLISAVMKERPNAIRIAEATKSSKPLILPIMPSAKNESSESVNIAPTMNVFRRAARWRISSRPR